MKIDQSTATQIQEDTMYGQYILFALDKEEYGLEIRYVTEIIGMQEITQLPETPDYIRGVVNLRDKIIPVIDMRLKFKKESAEYTDRTSILVIDTNEISAGLIVDRVLEVMNITDAQISPPPSARTGVQNKYFKGIGNVSGQIKLLLDCEKLFDEEEMFEINNSIEE